MNISIALIGDYNESILAHTAIPLALEYVSHILNINISWSWIETNSIDRPKNLANFDGIWLVPGSPYNDMHGALAAIQFARENNRPFLGTCGGFQHALIEYARNVCGLIEADHAENNPECQTLIVTPLACSLVGKTEQISFIPGSQLHKIFKGEKSIEAYHCNYGVNLAWRFYLEQAGIRFTGFDSENQIRAFELPSHLFFIGTLFQPERSALNQQIHPLIIAFIEAILQRAHHQQSRLTSST